MGLPSPFPRGGGQGLSWTSSLPGSGPIPRKISVLDWLPSGLPGVGGSEPPASPSGTLRAVGSAPEFLVFSVLIRTISGMSGGVSVSSPSPCFAPLGFPSKSIITLAGIGAVSNAMSSGIRGGANVSSPSPCFVPLKLSSKSIITLAGAGTVSNTMRGGVKPCPPRRPDLHL